MKKVALIKTKKIVSVILTSIFILIPSISIAASITPISDSLSTIKASTLADHTIQFLATTGIQDNSETITITFQTFDLGVIAFGDIDIATSTTDCTSPTFADVTVAASAAAGTWGVSTSSQIMTLTAPTDASSWGVTAGTCMQIQIGENATGGASNNQITNPGAGDYTIAVAGTFADTGTTTIKVLTDDQVQLTAEVPQSITFSISETDVAFGNLSVSATRYATTGGGNNDQTSAHTIGVGTNATGGYTLTVEGNTLNVGAYDITVIGDTAAATSTGGEQFGIRVSDSGGSGITVDPTYSHAYHYGYDGVSSASTVSIASGASDTTTYTVYYAANIASDTEAGSYTAALTYVATANY
ncbi:MAG: hypothetical protein KAR24_01250 [Candidatus Pacebacteria bacterium]|nr:hypothetical protein [Candidatus Paceibacterota bacterium]